jgi:predicted nucleotidyltransferase
MDTAQARTALTKVISALKQELADDLVAVVLFGSRARGDANEASDWDLMIIARNLPDQVFERHLVLKTMLPIAWRGITAILAKTPQEFEARLPGLYLDIALDGIVLYDTHEYIAERLARLRRLIQKKGLRRELSQRDMVWRWQKFPGFNWSLEWEAAT